MDNQARDYAQQHLETLACNDARARLHAAKELSWMTGDDSRHLGLVEGTIEANRKAVFDEDGLEVLVDLIKSDDSVGAAGFPRIFQSVSGPHRYCNPFSAPLYSHVLMFCFRAGHHCTNMARVYTGDGDTKGQHNEKIREHIIGALAGILQHPGAAEQLHDELDGTQALIDIYLEESDESILKVATSGGGDIHKPTAKCMQALNGVPMAKEMILEAIPEFDFAFYKSLRE